MRTRTASPLKASDLNRQVVQSVRDFGDCGFDSGSKIEDHSSGDILVFKTSFSVFSRVGEPCEDVSDIIKTILIKMA